MKEDTDDPFRAFDAILGAHAHEPLAAILVDFHAEATSEKVAFGWYADRRASAVIGTHTHVPTADAMILPGGTAYITDLGMTGAKDSVIGVDKDIIVRKFLTQLPIPHEVPETGTAVVNGLVVRVSAETRQATSIEKLYEEVTIP